MPLIHSKEGQWTGPWGSTGSQFSDLREAGDLDFGEAFSFGALEQPADISIDFNKEAYREAIVAPAEQARKDATLEAVQSARATAAMTGRPAGDVESEVLQKSVKQAGATSATAAVAAEEAGLKADVAEAQLQMEDLNRRTQIATAKMQLKVEAWSVMEKIKASYGQLRMQLANDRKMLVDRLGFEAGEAEANRLHDIKMKTFELNAGMQMLKFKETNANLRAEAGLAADERESLRDHSYRMQYLDAWREIQGMETLLKWREKFGRAGVYFTESSRIQEGEALPYGPR